MRRCTYKHSQAHLKRDKKESKRVIALLSKQSQAHLKRDEKQHQQNQGPSKQSQAHLKKDEKHHQEDHRLIDAPSIDWYLLKWDEKWCITKYDSSQGVLDSLIADVAPTHEGTTLIPY